MRILHTSDWHLGRIFHGLHMTQEQEVVLKQLTALARERKVDVILLAGDVYDRAVPPTEAVSLLNRTLNTLINELHIPVIMIAGNHDNPARLDFGRELLAGRELYIYGSVEHNSPPVVLRDEYGPVYFAPLSYCDPLTATELSGKKIATHEEALQWQLDNMLSQIPETARKVALAHVFLNGAETTPDSERPLSIGGTTTVSINNFAPFCYVALGHLHACQTSSNSVRYSGSLLKYSFNETRQKKAVHIVDLDAAGTISVETVALTPLHELAQLQGSFEELLHNPVAALQDHYLQITLNDEAPILDAKYRLEAVYPHILHLEYAQLAQLHTLPEYGGHPQELNIEELFGNFFRQLKARSLNKEEASLLEATLNDVLTSERRL